VGAQGYWLCHRNNLHRHRFASRWRPRHVAADTCQVMQPGLTARASMLEVPDTLGVQRRRQRSVLAAVGCRYDIPLQPKQQQSATMYDSIIL